MNSLEPVGRIGSGRLPRLVHWLGYPLGCRRPVRKAEKRLKDVLPYLAEHAAGKDAWIVKVSGPIAGVANVFIPDGGLNRPDQLPADTLDERNQNPDRRPTGLLVWQAELEALRRQQGPQPHGWQKPRPPRAERGGGHARAWAPAAVSSCSTN